MKNLIKITLILMLFSIQSIAIEIQDWDIKKDIELKTNSQYQKIILDEEVYKYTANNLRDLRIIDSSNEASPFYIKKTDLKSEKEELSKKTVKINSYKKKDSFFIEFKALLDNENSDFYSNILKFSIPRSNFHKKVNIYGSYDNLNWDFIIADSLYLVNDIKKDEVKLFTAYKYRYYKVEIKKNIENINFSSLKLIERKNHSEYSQNIKSDKNIHYTRSEDENITVLEIDNNNYLNLSSIELDIVDNYRRRYRLSGVDKNSNNESFISSGYLYQMLYNNNNLIKNNIDIKKESHRFSSFVLEIYNNDNKALNIIAINKKYILDQIIFEAKEYEKYFLVIGNKEAKSVNYDITYFAKQINMDLLDKAILKKAASKNLENINSKSKKTDKNYKLIFNIVISIIGLVFILIVFLSFKRKLD